MANQQYEVHRPDNGFTSSPFATEAEAAAFCKQINGPRHGNKAAHWSRRAIVRPVSIASMQTVGAA